MPFDKTFPHNFFFFDFEGRLCYSRNGILGCEGSWSLLNHGYGLEAGSQALTQLVQGRGEDLGSPDVVTVVLGTCVPSPPWWVRESVLLWLGYHALSMFAGTIRRGTPRLAGGLPALQGEMGPLYTPEDIYTSVFLAQSALSLFIYMYLSFPVDLQVPWVLRHVYLWSHWLTYSKSSMLGELKHKGTSSGLRCSS